MNDGLDLDVVSDSPDSLDNLDGDVSLDYDFDSLEGLILENQEALEVLSTEATATSTLVAQSNDLLLHIYAAQLYFIGVCGAVLVIALLYKFLRKFF